MALLGADTDELREVGQEFQQGKETVDEVIMFLRALIAILRAASFFSGGASAAYAQYLESTVVPWLQKISQALGLFAQVLNSQAQAQDDTSDGARVNFSSLPSYTTPALPAALTPYAGAPIVGGAADGAVAAGGTGSAVTATPATTSSPGVALPAGHADDTAQVSPVQQTGTSSIGSIPLSTTGTAGSAGAGHGGAGSSLGSSLGSSGGIGSGGGLSGAGSDAGGSAGSGSGSGSSGGSSGGLGGHGAGSLGTGSLGGGTGSGSITTNTPLDGALGGATPGSSDAGTLAAGAQAGKDSPVSAATIGAAASGAAALGVGGAALAARAGQGGTAIDSLAATNGRGSKGAEVKDLQEKLTAAGYDTKGTDGQWGGNTQRAYDAYRADHPLDIRQGTGYTSPDGYDYKQITGIQNTSPEFLRAVEGMSQRLGAKPEHMLAAMSFETGGAFTSDVKNPHSSATGLIQFMDSTAKGMGTTTGDLAKLTPTQQLTYVEQYFQPYRGRLGDLDSVYSSILAGHPASGDTALFTEGTKAYAANSPLDTNHNGTITAAEASAHVRARMGSGGN